MKSLISFTTLLMLLFGTQVQAVPCAQTDTGVFKEGSLDSSTLVEAWSDCEDGTTNNDPFPSAYIGFPDPDIIGSPDMIFDALEKINYGGADELLVDIDLEITPTGAATQGSWSFTNVAEYDQYVIVLKDGGTYPDGVKWAAYLLDSELFDATTGSTWAGDWIYGYNIIPGKPIQGTGPPPIKGPPTMGDLKDLSHLSVYGKLVRDRPPGEGEEVPAPGVLVLFGTGLVLMRMRRRKMPR
jgi:hypothetical protein